MCSSNSIGSSTVYCRVYIYVCPHIIHYILLCTNTADYSLLHQYELCCSNAAHTPRWGSSHPHYKSMRQRSCKECCFWWRRRRPHSGWSRCKSSRSHKSDTPMKGSSQGPRKGSSSSWCSRSLCMSHT